MTINSLTVRIIALYFLSTHNIFASTAEWTFPFPTVLFVQPDKAPAAVFIRIIIQTTSKDHHVAEYKLIIRNEFGYKEIDHNFLVNSDLTQKTDLQNIRNTAKNLCQKLHYIITPLLRINYWKPISLRPTGYNTRSCEATLIEKILDFTTVVTIDCILEILATIKKILISSNSEKQPLKQQLQNQIKELEQIISDPRNKRRMLKSVIFSATNIIQFAGEH